MQTLRFGISVKHLMLVWAFFLSFFSYGQKYSVGVKAAPLISWPSFGDREAKDVFDRNITGGFSAGAVLSFPLKHNFDFFTEGEFSQKRRTLEFNDGWKNRSTYNFLDGTLLLRKSYDFRLEKGINAQWFLNIGPQVSYWLGGHGELNVGGIAYPYEFVFNEVPDGNFTRMYFNDINRWLFGLTFGFGIKAPLLNGQHITTEFRFVSGHTFLGNEDSSKIEILTFQDTMKTNLKTVSINVAYTFDFDVQKSRMGKSTLKKRVKKNR